MNILIVSQYFWPENFRINDLAQELAKRGHNLTVLTGLPNYPDGRIYENFVADASKFNRYKNVNIVRVPLTPRGNGSIRLFLNYLSFLISACLLGVWKLKGRKFDVVLTCQLSPVTVGLPGALLGWLKSAPMAMWVLDLWPDTLKAIGVVKSQKTLQIISKLVAFIYKHCDLILAQSRSFIPKIQNMSDSSVPVVYFPSWAEDLYKFDAVQPALEVPVVEGTFNVMFAGNVGEAQDFECILSAAVLLKGHTHIRWLIVGDGRMSGWVKSQIELRELTRTVFLLGRYPLVRMPEFFVHADAMLVTLSDQEIFSMTIPGKIQSYLAAGIPIIAALNGEGADVIRNANAGLTCMAGSSEGLAALVIKMSELSVEERKILGRNGFEYSNREFNRRAIVDSLEKLLSELCK